MMKVQFAKLLLGGDMSGGGNGVSTSLAISNAITDLYAAVFDGMWRLEPLAPEKKSMWQREMYLLLSVSSSIVKLIPCLNKFPGVEDGTIEIMVAQPRSDLHVNLPKLKELDAMLLGILDEFQDKEFWYIDREKLLHDSDLGERFKEKWWLPCPMVPPDGLSADARRRLHQCRESVNGILQDARAINSSVLAEMETPGVYLESLPKNGKSCLGDIIYRHITADQFSPERVLNLLDLSSEHRTLETADRIEGALHVWKQKDHKKHSPKTGTWRRPWGGKVKALIAYIEKMSYTEKSQRAESLLQCLRLRYPGLPQTVLDTNKIQYNKDIGKSILESYSRVLESFAFNIMAMIDDVLYIDDMKAKKISSSSFSTQKSSDTSPFGTLISWSPTLEGGSPLIQKEIPSNSFSMLDSPDTTPFTTLSDTAQFASLSFWSSTPEGGSPGRVEQPKVIAVSENNEMASWKSWFLAILKVVAVYWQFWSRKDSSLTQMTQ